MNDISDFVVCIDPAGEDDLKLLRVYRALPDVSAEAAELLRVVDDSGEDYLYPAALFIALPLEGPTRAAIEAALALPH